MIKDDIIIFRDYKWRVLDIKDSKALVIAEDIIELRWYNDNFVDTTWAECELRKYLNNEFYETFNQDEKSKIVAVTNCNPDNQWFKTKGGKDTIDRIFLLSLEEVCKYFGDSIENLLNKGSQKWLINDENKQNMVEQIIGGDFVHRAIMVGLLPVLTPRAMFMSVAMEYLANRETVAESDQLYG